MICFDNVLLSVVHYCTPNLLTSLYSKFITPDKLDYILNKMNTLLCIVEMLSFEAQCIDLRTYLKKP